MPSEKNNEQDAVKNLVNAVGAMSELALIFYRNAIRAGATKDESLRLTQAFIAANLFGKTDQGG